MTRYFFHTIDGQVIIDTVGTELPDLEAVRSEAVRTAGEILRDTDSRQLSKSTWHMAVADHTGKTVYSLRFEATEYQ
jgi:hypothetical protein